MKALAVILIVGGILALAYGGFSYTTRKKAVDMGPLQIERTKHHSVPLPPLLGVAGLLLGGAILFADSSRSR